MPISYVRGQSGKIYPFNISGFSPNEVEKQKIEQVLSGLGDSSVFVEEQEEEAGILSGLGRGFRRGVGQTQALIGDALPALVGDLIGADEYADKQIAEYQESMEALNKELPSFVPTFKDIENIGDASVYAAETIGQFVPSILTSIAGGGIGGFVGKKAAERFAKKLVEDAAKKAVQKGTKVGFVSGTFAGSGSQTIPEAYTSILEETGEKQAALAFITGSVNASLDSILPVALVNRLTKKSRDEVARALVSRLFIAGGKGAVTEGLTEGIQESNNLLAAKIIDENIDFFSGENIDRIMEAGVRGAIGGKAIGVLGGFKGESPKQAQRRLETEALEDAREQGSQIQADLSASQKKLIETDPDEAVAQAVAKQGISLEKEQARQAEVQKQADKINAGNEAVQVSSLPDIAENDAQSVVRLSRQGLQQPQTETITPAELRDYGLNDLADQIQADQLGALDNRPENRATAKRPFTQSQYDAAVERAKSDGEVSVDSILEVAKTKKGDPISRSAAEKIRDEMIVNRVVQQTSPNKFETISEEQLSLDPAEPLRRVINQKKKKIESLEVDQKKQQSIEEKILEKDKLTPRMEAQLQASRQQRDQIDKTLLSARAEARNIQRQIDTIDSRTQAQGQLKAQKYSQEDSNLALAAAREASKLEASQKYAQREKKIVNQLRKELKGLTGKDAGVTLGTETVIDTQGRGDIAEGSYRPYNKVITLAMGIYDPSLTDAQKTDRLRSVMNHEVIHALRDSRLFTDQEFEVLKKAASKRRFVMMKDGQRVERNYTFLDRARQINRQGPQESKDSYNERVAEEAVAEMFRSWADGNLKVAGRPLTLFQRIVNFFKRVQDVHTAEGFSRVEDIFTNIQTGKIGQRDPNAAGMVRRRSSIAADKSSFPIDKSQIDVRQLKNFIISNPDGFTVTIDGAPTPKTGFAVAPIKQTEIISSAKKFTIEDVKEQVRNILNLMQSYKDTMGIDVRVYAGGWFDGDNNQYVLDASVIIDDKADALYVGSAGNQDAIADLGAINQGDFDNAIIGTETGIEQIKQDGTYRGELENVRRADHAKLVKRFEELRVRDRGRDQFSEQLDRTRDSRSDVVPEVDENGLVTLTHFSRLDNLTEIDPARQGSNLSIRGREEARRMMHGPEGKYGDIYPARSYFGLNLGQDGGYIVEYGVGQNRYETKVPIDSLYNLTADPDGFESRARAIAEEDVKPFSPQTEAKETNELKATLTEKMIKDAGYEGYWVNSPIGMVAASFSKKKVTTPDKGPIDLSSFPSLPMAQTDRVGPLAHRLPKEILVEGNGQKATIPIPQQFNPNNKQNVFDNINALKAENPDAMSSAQNFLKMEQEAMGGDFLPFPPLNAISYSNSPEAIANKLRNLSPQLKAGVDEGFGYVSQIKNMYDSGQATPEMTIKLFLWGILSRGAGPVQQEAAYLDIVKDATPLIKKAEAGLFTEDDIITWENTVKKYLLPGSPGKSVTMNVNSAGKLLFEMSKRSKRNDNITVAEEIHELMSDPQVSGKEVRRTFLDLTNKPGIDNKVVSFIMLVAGKTDVLVMDRIQTINMFDDGRFGGSNIYDGIGLGTFNTKDGKQYKSGYNRLLIGPRGLLVTEFMEDGISKNIQEAYEMLGRPEDASLGRFHWESWVIEGDQVVNHSTLEAIAENSPIGYSVTEGKPATFSSGMTYTKTENGAVVSYPLSDGDLAFMTPDQFSKFTKRMSDKGVKDGIYPKGFLISNATSSPWYTLPEVDRSKIDELAREYENARPNGSLRDGTARSRGDTVTINRGDGAITRGRDERRDIADALADDVKKQEILDTVPDIADMSSLPVDFSSAHIAEAQNSIVYAKSYDVLKKALNLVTLGSEKKAVEAANTFGDLFQDRFLPIAQVVDKLRAEGATIEDAFDPYLQESLYHGRTGDRLTQAQHSLYEPARDKVAEINLDDGTNYDALAAGSEFVKLSREETGSRSLSAVDAYLYALHAKERNAYIRSINEGENAGSGMSDGEADFIISWVDSLDAVNRQKFQDVRSIVRDIVNDTNKVRVEGGLIPADLNEGNVEINEDGETRPAPNFKEYVPLRGVLDPEGEASEEGSFGAARGQTFSIRGKEDRRTLGRYEYGTSILAGTFMQNQNAIIRSEKNAVGQSFLKLVREQPESMARVAVELKSPPMRRGLVEGSVKMIYDFQAKNDDSIFVVKENGKEILIKTRDPRVAKALKGRTGAPNQVIENVVRSFGKMNRYLSNINTTFNPEFIITNFFRDVQTAGVNINQYEKAGLSKELIKNYREAYKGVKDVVFGQRRDSKTGRRTFASDITKEIAESEGFDINKISPADLFRLFQIYGGQNSLNQMDTLQDQINNIKSLVGDIAEDGIKGKFNKVKNSFIGEKVGSLFGFIEDVNTVVENAIRVSTFKTLAPKIGFERAAFAARNVTVDFAKGGELKPFMNSLYLFYNASLQGSFALINAATRSSKVRKLWVSTVMAGLILDQFNALNSEEDEDGELIYDKAPEYILEHNMLIYLGDLGPSERSHFALPLPYGLNIGFNLGRSLSRALRGGYDVGEASSSIIMTALDALNPLGGTNDFYNFAAPTILDPFVDIMQNKEEFSGRPIVKEVSPFDPTPPPNSQLYWSTTSPSLKWATDNLNKLTGGSTVESGLLDFSPDIVDYWLNYLTGGAGMFVNRTIDFTTETIPKALSDGFEDEFVRQTPFLRKAFYSVSQREDVAGFIENRNKVLKAKEVLDDAVARRDMSAIRSVRSRYEKELAVFGKIRAINSARNRIIRKLKEIDANPRLSDEQKNKVTERLRENLEVLIQRGNKIMRQADI